MAIYFLLGALTLLGAVVAVGRIAQVTGKRNLKSLAGETSVFGLAGNSLATEKFAIRKAAREKGLEGEIAIGDYLNQLAKEYGLTVLHDLSMPNSKANIDHLMVSKKAVFVLDSKNYAGLVNIRKDQSGAVQLFVGKYNRTNLAMKLKQYSDSITSHLESEEIDIPVIPLLAFYKATFHPQSKFSINGVVVNVAGIENELIRFSRGSGKEFDIKLTTKSILEHFPVKNPQ